MQKMENAYCKIELEDFITQHCFHAVGQQIMASMDFRTFAKCRLLNSLWKGQVDKYSKVYSKVWDISELNLGEPKCRYWENGRIK